MNIDDISCVAIVGSGTMGQQIGLQCAMHAYDVILYDIAPEALQNARSQIKTYADGLVSQNRLTQNEAETALSRIRYTTNPQDAAEADLLSESVPEDPVLKAKVFAQFNPICPPRAIFTTNTSTLIPSMFADATGRPAQFAALHFHGYVWDSNVVDVMPHPGTSPETVQLLLAFAKKIGQIPILLKKESYQYVFNAMLGAWNTAALKLVTDGVASVEDVDRAWMGVMKTPIGAFGIMDLVGLKTVWDITEYWANVTGDAQLRANAGFLKGYLDQGWLGVKSGKGFYSYPDPAYARPGFLTGEGND
jgi:3-hydroxybutyryl-CoA dehydrogenase